MGENGSGPEFLYCPPHSVVVDEPDEPHRKAWSAPSTRFHLWLDSNGTVVDQFGAGRAVISQTLESVLGHTSNWHIISQSFELALEGLPQLVGGSFQQSERPTHLLELSLADFADDQPQAVECLATPLTSGQSVPALTLEGAIAHEMTNSLATIANLAAAAKRQVTEPPGTRDIIEALSNQASECALQIKALRSAFLGILSNEENVDLNVIVRHTVEKHQGKLGDISIVLNLREELPEINADSIQLEVLFSNLIQNSIDAILRSSNACHHIEIRSDLTCNRDAILVSVADCGVGISSDLGLPPGPPARGGLGIGLSICHSIASAHQGVLRIAPNTSGGATASCRFPCSGGDR